jgi:Domain of unknown function (DUF5615)
MLLYADEDFPFPVVVLLRQLGHDVVTTQDDGRTGTPDPDLLGRAHELGRAFLTCNRRHFERLDRLGTAHSGILSVIRDRDMAALATRIHVALTGVSPGRWCLRVNRPPPKP